MGRIPQIRIKALKAIFSQPFCLSSFCTNLRQMQHLTWESWKPLDRSRAGSLCLAMSHLLNKWLLSLSLCEDTGFLFTGDLADTLRKLIKSSGFYLPLKESQCIRIYIETSLDGSKRFCKPCCELWNLLEGTGNPTTAKEKNCSIILGNKSFKYDYIDYIS